MSDWSIVEAGPGQLQLKGEIDYQTAPAALERGLALLGNAPDCVIDLSGMSAGNSAGLAVLVEWLGSAHRRGARLRYTGVPTQMRAVARISALEELLVPA